MKLAIKTVLATSLLTVNALTASAYADPCDYDLEKDDLAHCTSVSADDGINKIIQITQTQGTPIAIGMCVSNGVEPLPIDKESVESGRVAPGQYFDNYVQCNDLECSNQKPLGKDSYTVNADHTINPYKFSVTLDTAFGNTCHFDNDMFLPGYSTSCDNANYCISIASPASTNKYVKVVSNDGMFVTMCANTSTHYTSPQNPPKAGNHELAIYQCNDVQCANSKLLGKDSVKVSPNGDYNHKSFSINLDPNFGENCEPFSTKSGIAFNR